MQFLNDEAGLMYRCNVCGVTEDTADPDSLMWSVCEFDGKLKHYCKEDSASHHICSGCYIESESIGLGIMLDAKLDMAEFQDICGVKRV